jgi:hypothetical protein
MKTIIKIKLLLLCLYLFPNLDAQVNIGTVEVPADGALLQLKTIAGAAKGGENANKGLLLPRVSLVDYLSLEPAVSNASNDDKKEHIGLVVYNLTEDAHLKKGFAVWNGTKWNSITNKEIDENIGMDIRKNLYSATQPQENITVEFRSIQIRMIPGKSVIYDGIPQFRAKKGIYEYQISQYWTNNGNNGYSTFVSPQVKVDVTPPSYSDYKNLDHISNIATMSVQERNEVWMYDETNNEIFHIQLFIMGKNEAAATKTYAILVEQF